MSDLTSDTLDAFLGYAKAYLDKLDRPAQAIIVVRVLGEEGGIGGVNIARKDTVPVMEQAVAQAKEWSSAQA